MQNKPLTYIFSCLFFAVVGMSGGYYAGSKKSTESSHGHGDSHDDHHAHEGDTPVLSTHVLKNLKIDIQEAEESTYELYRSVNARVEETAESVLFQVAPIGGYVDKVHVTHDEMVEAGSVLITILRDAIKRPELKLTGALLDPEQKFKGLTLDDIEQQQSLSNSARQVSIWKAALTRGGYWTSEAERLYSSLPDEISRLPFSVGVVGELSANGYLAEAMLNWFQQKAEIGEDFFEISSLILDGVGLAYVQEIHRLGAFQSKVMIRVPMLESNYDVHGIFVKPGDHVEVGQKLVELHDQSKVHMVATGVHSEIPILMNALKSELAIKAVPQIQGSGLILENLKILSIQDNSNGGASAHLEIEENPFIIKTDKHNKKFRSWEVRAGTRYLLRVPQSRLESVFVFHKNALVEDGQEKIVFVPNGNKFEPRYVVVLFQNDEVVVLSQDSDLFPGDSVVVRGAFELSLALQAQKGGAIDPHAGHSH